MYIKVLVAAIQVLLRKPANHVISYTNLKLNVIGTCDSQFK